MDGFPPSLPSYLPSSGWRSTTGMVVPPPAQPEVRPADEYGFAVSVQWPAVLQAAAYVVELREAGSVAFERFVRSAPEAKLGTLVELRVGGLRPGPPPGRVYVAQVRTVAVDGSESQPSPPGVSPPLPAANGAAAPGAPAGGAEVRATGSILSADAPAWNPGAATYEMPPIVADQNVAGMGAWAPPPWLGQLQQGGTAMGSLGPLETGPPGAPPPPTGPAPAPAAGIRPAPPNAPPDVRPGEMPGAPPPGEASADGAGDSCLILD